MVYKFSMVGACICSGNVCYTKRNIGSDSVCNFGCISNDNDKDNNERVTETK
jgi:hypothetical protein